MSVLKLLIPAGKATPSPPIGPALGQRGVKSMDFCKQFNARTATWIEGTPVRTFVTVNKDRTFTFETKTPPTSWLLKKAAGIEKGMETPGKDDTAAPIVSLKQVYEIAKIKQVDEPHLTLEQISRSVIGSSRSCGIKIVD